MTAWDDVRRTLGRIVGRATVRDVSAEARAVRAGVRVCDVASGLTVSPGGREGDWRPETGTLSLPLPAASEGGAGADLATVATIVSLNRAFGSETATVQCPAWQTTGGTVRQWDLGGAVLSAPSVWAGVVQYPPVVVWPGLKQIGMPGLHSLAIRPVILERKKRLRGEPMWRIRPPRVGSGGTMLARVPMTRAGLLPPLGMTMTDAFAAERRQLAEASSVAEADVLLVGVFPQVPLALVQKLSVLAEGGIRLHIWLKPEAWTARRPVKLATVILGRQRSTGRVLQTVAKPAALNAEKS